MGILHVAKIVKAFIKSRGLNKANQLRGLNKANQANITLR